jgi:3-isopropylmalate/(R)-2-methylmalate dehydratase small subunit
VTGIISGTVAVFGDYVSADVVLPARHSFLAPAEMAGHVLEELSPDANARVRAHDILVVGQAFGYGTGRESPSRALRAAGVKAVLGASFARMFFRNAINNGVLVLDCPEIVASGIAEGDRVEIDIDAGAVRWKDRRFAIPPVPPIVRDIVAAGSLIDYGRTLLATRAAGARP